MHKRSRPRGDTRGCDGGERIHWYRGARGQGTAFQRATYAHTVDGTFNRTTVYTPKVIFTVTCGNRPPSNDNLRLGLAAQCAPLAFSVLHLRGERVIIHVLR